MKRHLFVLCSAVALAWSVAVPVFAADGDKKAEAKPEGSKTALYCACCPSPCDFCVKSHDKHEVAALVKEHAKNHHNMDMSDADAQAMVKADGDKK